MIAGLLLAAGSSRRMGRPKQLLDWGGVPLVRHVANQALGSSLDALYVVVGAAASETAFALEGLALTLVENPEYQQGLGSSLARGIAALPAETQAVVILLGDQPLVTPALIDRLLQAAGGSTQDAQHQQSQDGQLEQALTQTTSAQQPPTQAQQPLIVAPLIGGRRANPVLFKAPLFPELLQLAGDQGARQVVEAHQAELLLLPADAGLDADLDTPEDYRLLLGQQTGGVHGS